jgi:hypothetical protein
MSNLNEMPREMEKDIKTIFRSGNGKRGMTKLWLRRIII